MAVMVTLSGLVTVPFSVAEVCAMLEAMSVATVGSVITGPAPLQSVVKV